jgi:hypothetical protein
MAAVIERSLRETLNDRPSEAIKAAALDRPTERHDEKAANCAAPFLLPVPKGKIPAQGDTIAQKV